MPKIEASMEDAQGSIILPDKKWQHATVSALPLVTQTKGNPQTGSRAGNPMATVELEILDGDFRGAKIFGHNIMLGGTTGKGSPMPLRNLMEMLDAMAADGVSWSCLNCHREGDRRFKRGENGTKDAGKYMCPDCNEVSHFSFDTDDWQGHRLNVLVNVGKYMNSDEPRNEVARIRPYGEIVEDDNLPFN